MMLDTSNVFAKWMCCRLGETRETLNVILPQTTGDRQFLRLPHHNVLLHLHARKEQLATTKISEVIEDHGDVTGMWIVDDKSLIFALMHTYPNRPVM